MSKIRDDFYASLFNEAAVDREPRQLRLLQLGAGEDDRSVYGARLLAVASRLPVLWNRDAMIEDARALISLDADVNLQDEETGNSALHFSALYGSHPLTEALIDCDRCDHLLRNNDGQYAYEQAEWRRDFVMAERLMVNLCRQASERGISGDLLFPAFANLRSARQPA